jgi:hypothetical protein
MRLHGADDRLDRQRDKQRAEHARDDGERLDDAAMRAVRRRS